MAVKRQFQGVPGIRYDLPFSRSIESAVSFDFDSALRGAFTGLNRPYLLRGFEIQIPTAAISASSLQVIVSDSAVMHSSAAESGTILTVPLGTPDDILNPSNPNVVGAFQNGVANYVGLAYTRASDPSTTGNVAVWSQAQKTEFTQTLATGRVLNYQYVISSSGFGTNLPLYIVGVSLTGAVQYITKGTTNLFRLGSGGTVPNPYNSYDWGSEENPENPSQPRQEWVNQAPTVVSNPVSVVPGNPQNAFLFGDFVIGNMKDWMDAIMTRFKELTGSDYWYMSTQLPDSQVNTFDVWYDSVGSVLTGAGNISYNLVLESTALAYGAYQSQFTDPSINPGDSYLVGLSSGNKATLQSFNIDTLIINSQTKTGWTYGETLWNRRVYDVNLAMFQLVTAIDGSDQVGYFSRLLQNGAPSYVTISSWSFATGGGVGLPSGGALVTVNFSAPHGFNVGDYVFFEGLTATTNSIQGTYMIKQVPSNVQVQFTVSLAPTGTTSTAPTCQATKDLQPSSTYSPRFPYLPQWTITGWSYVGTTITLTVPGHSLVTGANIVVFGLVATTNAPNGRYLGITVNPDQTISFTAGLTPTGTATLAARTGVQLDSSVETLTIAGASPSAYDVPNVSALFASDTDIEYVIGPSSAPPLAPATGNITTDGVVAISTVANPVQITEIQYVTTPAAWSNLTSYSLNQVVTYSGAVYISLINSNLNNQPSTSPSDWAVITVTPAVVVSTATAHGFNTIPGPITFTIYGNPANSEFIATYSDVSLQNISPDVFSLTGSGITGFSAVPTYINGGTDQTFARYPNNPFPGPVQWTSDMYVKAIIGDRYLRIPVTATVDPESPAGATANQFNINGQTGTVFLEDGQVAYVVQIRDESVSSGATFTTLGGSGVMTGSTPPVDPLGGILHIGDFVKFVGEPETQWCRISNEGYPSLNEGDPLPSNATTFYLISDQGQPPSQNQRPANTGPLVFCKGTYPLISAAPWWQVPADPNVYWIAARRDNGSPNSKVYMRSLDLSAGQVGSITSNLDSNLLIYTGAGNSAAVNPNYQEIDSSGDWQATQNLQVGPNPTDIDVPTQQVTFVAGPNLGFQVGDQVQYTVGPTTYTYTVTIVQSSRTVIFQEAVSTLATNATVTYLRLNYNIQDQDNLTLAIRKEDRYAAQVNTALTRPIYDESAYIQQVNLSGSGTIRSGSYVYTGSQTNPTCLAWVMNGTAPVTELVEDAMVTMPGGAFGSNALLISFITGSFNDGDALFQNGVATGRTVNNPSNPPFGSPAIPGSLMAGLVLPPNRRTQVIGSSYVTFPANAVYKASQVNSLAGEELLVVINDTIRQATVDYSETFGGPKAQIQLIRDLPANTRIRFRILPAYGSALSKIAGAISLQLAYNGGSIINALIGNPVTINVGDGSTGLQVNQGSISVNGVVGGNVVGGFYPLADLGANAGSASLRFNQVWTAQLAIKSQAGFTGSQLQTYTAADTTTSSAPHAINLSNLNVPSGFACRIMAKAVARRSDGISTGGASFKLEGLFYNEGSGTTAAGSPESEIIGYYGEGSGYALAFGLVGNQIVVVAYGSSGVVEWATSIEYQMVSIPT